MTTEQTPQISNEAIAFQKGSPLFRELTELLADFVDRPLRMQTADAFENLKAADVIFKHTGIKIAFNYTANPHCFNAAVYPPLLDINSPLMDAYRHVYGLEEEDLAPWIKSFHDLKAKDAEMRACIDLKNGKVSGLFSKISCELLLGQGLWTVGRLSPEELAAIILHEVGHCFTFFESFLYVATTNMALATALRALARIDDQTHRIQLVAAMSDALHFKPQDAAKLTEAANNPQAFAMIVLKSQMDPNLRSTAGSWEYDLRSAEFLADQFAARQGAGRALVTGLDRLYHLGGDDHRRSTLVAWMSRVGEVIGLLMMGGLIAIGVILAAPPFFLLGIFFVLAYAMALFSDATGLEIYDRPLERLERVRRDMIQTLKSTDLTPADRRRVNEDIAVIDRTAKGMKDHITLLEWFWRILSSKRRDQLSQMQFQQQLEKIVNNDLYLHASRLQSLA